MSFGISGHPSRVQMVGGDVAVAWVDKDSFMGYSKDYYLDAKSQCAGVRGTCPDERIVVSFSVRLTHNRMSHPIFCQLHIRHSGVEDWRAFFLVLLISETSLP